MERRANFVTFTLPISTGANLEILLLGFVDRPGRKERNEDLGSNVRMHLREIRSAAIHATR